MPHCPKAKRAHDGADVRVYPVAGGSHKRTSPNEFPQKLPPDEALPEDVLRVLATPVSPSSSLPAACMAAAGAAPGLEFGAALPQLAPAAYLPPDLAVAAPASDAVAESPLSGARGVDRFSVCIVGAGAIGCHLAYVLQTAGNDVTLIARGANLKALQDDGLHMTICGEDVGRVKIRATDDPEEVGQVDYVFLTMKVSGYDSKVAALIKPLIGDKTTILPPTTSIPYWWFHDFKGELRDSRLSRVDPGGTLWELLPPRQVIGFTMWLSAVQEAPGKVVLRHVQRGYPLGELDGSSSARVDRLAAALERGGVPAPRVPCIRSEIFIKSLNSLAFNVVAVLGDASNGTIADVPEAVATLMSVMSECEAIAGALGLTVAQSAESRVKQTLSARMHTMSMLHDLRVGKRLELAPLWTSFQDLAELVGVALPVTRALVGVALLREASERERRGLAVNCTCGDVRLP